MSARNPLVHYDTGDVSSGTAPPAPKRTRKNEKGESRESKVRGKALAIVIYGRLFRLGFVHFRFEAQIDIKDTKFEMHHL